MGEKVRAMMLAVLKAVAEAPTFGLFDLNVDLRAEHIEGLAPGFVFGRYRENPAEFTCEVEDEWDVATLLRFVFHEP